MMQRVSNMNAIVSSMTVGCDRSAVLAFSNSIFGPAATGLVSVFADPTEQGTVLGAAQALSALGRLLGPLTLGKVYDASHPAAFLVAGAVMAMGGLVCLRVPKTAEDHVNSQQALQRLDAQTHRGEQVE